MAFLALRVQVPPAAPDLQPSSHLNTQLNKHPPSKNQNRALTFGLVSVACWSTVATAFKLALREVDIWQLVFCATATATLTLLLVALVQGQGRQLLKDIRFHWRFTLLAGMMNPVLYYLILFKVYDLLPAQVAQSINYTWSIVLTLLAMLILKHPVRAWDLAAAAVCYLGVFLIATQGDLSSFSGSDLLGVSLALLSTLVWAGYWIANIRDPREPATGLCLNFLAALPVTLALCLIFSEIPMSAKGLAATVYVGLAEMAIAFLFWSAALRLTTNASRVSNLIFLSPFVSLVIINQVLGEEIHTTTLAGLMMIVSALLYQQYMSGKHPAQAG